MKGKESGRHDINIGISRRMTMHGHASECEVYEREVSECTIGRFSVNFGC